MIRSLSYSATRTFLECAYRFQLHYLERRPVAVSPPLFLGATVHLTLSTFYQRRMQGNPMSLVQCESFFSDAFQRQTILEQEPAAQGVSWESQDPNILEAETLSLLKLYLDWAEKTGLRPAAIELDLRRTVDGLPISGRIDIVDRSGIIIDWKTTQQPGDQEKRKRDLQPLFYAALLGHPIEFHYHYLPKGRIHEIRWDSRKVSRAAMRWLTEAFLPPVWEAMQHGPFPYADPSSWVCSPACCDYWGICNGGALRPVCVLG